MITFPKKERGGPSLGNQETVHILREPPKSIHTRKKERVSESDVLHMTRENMDRTSEFIMPFARGVNPMVGVSYNAHGSGASKLHTGSHQPQGHNAYKINEQFIPPIFRQEDQLPLSRQKRDLFSVHSKIESPYLFKNNVNEYRIDYEPIKKTVHINPMYPSGNLHQFSGNVVLTKKVEQYAIQGNLVAPTAVYGGDNSNVKLTAKTRPGYITPFQAPPMEFVVHPDDQLVQKNIIIKPVYTDSNINSGGHFQASNQNHQAERGVIDNPLRADVPHTMGIGTDQLSYMEDMSYRDASEEVLGDPLRPVIPHSYGVGSNAIISITDLDSREVSKEVIDNPLRTYLPASFTVAFYDTVTNNYREMVLPENIKEKISADVNRNAPLEFFSQGDNKVIRLKDYKWAIHRSNMDGSTLIIETPNRPDIYLEKNTPLTSAMSTVGSEYSAVAQVNAPEMKNSRPLVSINSAASSSNATDNLNRDINLPTSLNVGGYTDRETDPTMYVKENFDPLTYNRTRDKKEFLRKNLQLR
jgi:hypothetical protein